VHTELPLRRRGRGGAISSGYGHWDVGKGRGARRGVVFLAVLRVLRVLLVLRVFTWFLFFFAKVKSAFLIQNQDGYFPTSE
jgi:hypothetical protein